MKTKRLIRFYPEIWKKDFVIYTLVYEVTWFRIFTIKRYGIKMVTRQDETTLCDCWKQLIKTKRNLI